MPNMATKKAARKGTVARRRPRTGKLPATDRSKQRPRDARLAEALEQQAATAEILRVISRSPNDAQPVFKTIAAAALSLCAASSANVLTFDGQLLRIGALAVATRKGADAVRGLYPRPPSRDSAAPRAVLTRRIVAIPDVLEDSEYQGSDAAIAGGFRSVLAVPLLRKKSPIGAIVVGRPQPGPFPDGQVRLLETFAEQAVIAIENVRLFNEVQSRNRDLTEALEQQMATSEILRVISQSPTDVQPVFDTIAAAALKLCNASSANVFTYDGALVQLAALVNLTSAGADAVRSLWPRPLSRQLAACRAILTRDVVEIPDVQLDADFAPTAATAVAGNFRSILSVPLMREGSPIGAIAVGRPEAGTFPENQIALLRTFADQAVIAIENVRLFNELQARNRELTGALERETATGDVLKVISRSAFDLQPVLDTVIATAARLCGAEHGHVYRCDGELLRFAAGHSARPEMLDYLREHPVPIGLGSISGAAALRREPVHWHDVLAERGYQRGEVQRLGGYRTILAVPMLRDDALLGVIVMWKTRVEPFTDKQVELVATFADQAVIAIENVRLFNALEGRNRALNEALEQQIATSDVLRVISQSPTDIQPVFDAIARDAVRLCDATYSVIGRFDGEWLHLAAHEHVRAEGVEAMLKTFPMRPDRSTTSSRAILERAIVHVPDVLSDPDYAPLVAHGIQNRSTLAVPMLRNGEPIGSISVGRLERKPFTERQIALLQTFADQAVIAIENVRLFSELEMRTQELTRSVDELRALGEVGRAVSSTLDLETVLSTIVSRSTELAGLDGGSIWEYDETREEFQLHATHGLPAELVDVLRAAPIRKREGALGRLAVTLEPVAIPDIAAERSYPTRLREVLNRCGYRSVLAVPLLREDQLLGALAVNRSTPGDFTAEVMDLMQTFATQSALAIQNARLFREIEQKSRELETASRHKSEFLANMSHELRTPLNAVIGFSEVLQEQLFGPINDKQTEYIRDILESGRHLLSLINDILDLSKIEAGRMELEANDFDLPGTIENALILVRERAGRHGIALVHEVDDRLGSIHADQRKVKQVLLNLLTNALKFTPDGGRVEVCARAVDGVAEISVADTGIGIATEDQAAVFEEFRQVGTAAKKVEGTGLGLAISRKFIELHGGRIWLTSEVGVGSTFAFTLPLDGGPR